MQQMRFSVLAAGRQRRLQGVPPGFYLLTDNWDDWFAYSTQYDLLYQNDDGETILIGQVKIGQFAMYEDQRSPNLPTDFDELDNRFFSLGQDSSYYQELNQLGDDVRDGVLRALRDVAHDRDLFQRALEEEVTGTSLLRSVPRATVEGQFRRLAHGGARLSKYHLTYSSAIGPRDNFDPVSLDFDVIPESQPSTNIHVLIGRNGVGKTRILDHMARALVDVRAKPEVVGTFEIAGSGTIANLVSVTFSAFDPFEPISNSRNRADAIQYAYIGLKTIGRPGEKRPPKDWRALSSEFGKSVKICLQGARQVRWRRALEMLEADPIFSDAGVAGLADSATDDEEELRSQASQLFRSLSSGHKIVLLTITRLVETVHERSLVLIDEPEAHLHPPLLSAFTRTLSDLLINRNGVAIIATHSPVILQEVPRNCAWKLRRSGRETVAERPLVETFGENVGVLTQEIFGLEVSRSGFHRILGEAVRGGATYEQVIERFGGQLGGEARGLVRGLIAAQEAENEA
jgi:energy-coupling factor transporter ATP-binding protein EcfA2